MKDNAFTIQLMGEIFTSNEEGMLDLNDIWRGCGLENKKRPNQWDNEFKRSFIQTGNILSGSRKRVVDGVTTNLVERFILADEQAAIGYAMFVSVGFYREVVEAFVLLRQGDIASAAKIADKTQVESKAFAKWMSYADSTLQQSLGMIGIIRPNTFQAIAKDPQYTGWFISKGYLKYRNYGDKGVSLRVTGKGKQWMLSSKEDINSRVESQYHLRKVLS